MKSSTLLIKKLTTDIEKQLGWGEGANWSNKDFEILSEQIYRHTDKQLSVTTLKRIWGRAQRIANPSVASLDILANFAGFDDWRAFQKTANKSSVKPKAITNRSIFSWNWALGLLIILVGLSSFFLFKNDNEPPIRQLSQDQLDQIKFDFKKVAVNYPNTVIFKYDLGGIKYDSAAIQQSWDSNRRIKLENPNGLVTSTYFTSGYFNTKLVVDNQIVKEKDLYIPTNGWRGFMGGNIPQILYIKPEQIKQDSSIRTTASVLDQLNEYNPSRMFLGNLSATPKVNSANLELEADFRLIKATDKSICKKISLVIIGTKDVFMFQLGIPGCAGKLRHYIDNQSIDGKDHDLSSFGITPENWTNFKVVNQNNQLSVYLNQQLVYEQTLMNDIGLVGGAQFGFEGLGEIKTLLLNDDKEMINLLD